MIHTFLWKLKQLLKQSVVSFFFDLLWTWRINLLAGVAGKRASVALPVPRTVDVVTPLALHIAAVRAEGEVVPAIRGTIVDRSPHLGHVRPHHVGEVADIPVVILCSIWVVVVAAVTVDLCLSWTSPVVHTVLAPTLDHLVH